MFTLHVNAAAFVTVSGLKFVGMDDLLLQSARSRTTHITCFEVFGIALCLKSAGCWNQLGCRKDVEDVELSESDCVLPRLNAVQSHHVVLPACSLALVTFIADTLDVSVAERWCDIVIVHS